MSKTRLNNVNLETLERTLETYRTDPAQARTTNRVQGTWNLETGQPQVSAHLTFEGGEITFEADQPTAQGGGGLRPGPMLYCLYGMSSCYAATFATVAAMMGIELTALSITAECDLDFAPVFGLAEAPIVEGVRLTLHVESDAAREQIQEVERLAVQRCPGVYCMTNVIPLETRLA